MTERKAAIIDSSTLINFLAVDRTDLLERNRRYDFFITEHVRGEVSAAYPEQIARLEALIARGAVRESPLTDIAELRTFARLAASGRLGAGECASIAAACERKLVIAIDDKRAAREARVVDSQIQVRNTQTLMIEFIQDGLLDVAAADGIKATWQTQHRFRLPFASFREVLPP